MTKRLLAIATPLVLVLAAPGSALAAINESYRPQDEFKLDPWFSIGPIEFNKAVIYVFIATALTCGTMVYVARRMNDRPNRLQTAVEAAYVLMRDNITRGNMDDKMASRWFPFIATLFLFIWFSNMIGYLPLPTNTEHTVNIFGLEVPSLALYAATANLSVPLVLTLVVWVSYHVEGVRAKGFVGYLKSWIPAGVEGPARDPDLPHRGHLALRPPRLPERPTLRQHPRRPPADPVHGRRAGRAAQPAPSASRSSSASSPACWPSPSSSSRSAWSPPCRPSSSPPSPRSTSAAPSPRSTKGAIEWT